MSDATKIPFEPIPMPPLGPLPPFPEPTKASFSEPPKPAFSRSTMPPTGSMLPPTRKPVIADDDAVPLTKFLPSGIAPETPEPPKAELPQQSWLRRKRLKLMAGFTCASAAAYGFHEFGAQLKPDVNTQKPAEVAKPVLPKIAEERAPLDKPTINFERHEELKPLPSPILSQVEEPRRLELTAGTTPLSVVSLPSPSLPVEISTPAPIVAPSLPPIEPYTPPAIPSVIPEAPRALPPVAVETPRPIAVAPIELPKPETAPLPPVIIETPKPAPVATLPPVPIEAPKMGEIKPLPLPVPTPATTIASVPLAHPEPSKPVIVGEPKTDYDVDLHRVKSAETYGSISEKYYGNPQYASALKAYNRGAEVAQLREVQVPPMFVIRKMAPVPMADIVPAAAEDTNPKNTAGAGDVRFETFRVPRAGMTMRDVAKAVYGSEREWPRVDNRRNIKFRPDEELPVGAELQVPVERADWR